MFNDRTVGSSVLTRAADGGTLAEKPNGLGSPLDRVMLGHVWPRPPLLRRQRNQLVFGIPPERPTPNIAPSWNVAPTDPLPVVHYDAKVGQRS